MRVPPLLAFLLGLFLAFFSVLLEHFARDWRTSVVETRDPARLLAKAIDFRAPADLAREADRRGAQYDLAMISREEEARDSTRRTALAAYRAALVDGPTLTLTQNWLGRNFDPMLLIGFDAGNTVYPTGTFNAEWGSLEVTAGGALVANDQSTLRIRAPRASPAESQTVKGDGWVLTLKPGWSVQPFAERPGSYVVRQGTR